MGVQEFLLSGRSASKELGPWLRHAGTGLILLLVAALLPSQLGLVIAATFVVAVLAALAAHEARDEEESLRGLAGRMGVLATVALLALLLGSWNVGSAAGRLAWLATAGALGTAEAILPLEYQRLERWYLVPLFLTTLLAVAIAASLARALVVALG